MRTKTIEVIIDRAFWALVLCLPVIAYLILCIHFDTHSFMDIFNQFSINDSNIIYSALKDIFGSGGILEFFDTTNINPILIYMSYFISIELVHIIVDTLLFIPRVCVLLLDKASKLGSV